jgi:hypothetical protein
MAILAVTVYQTMLLWSLEISSTTKLDAQIVMRHLARRECNSVIVFINKDLQNPSRFKGAQIHN